ncbi:MAG: phosphoribosylglycinamide formyltransferase [Phycisphaerae bacterium]|nr:phosphoribosylglycinamide formyltransferase [Phycisphaerae bacterium]
MTNEKTNQRKLRLAILLSGGGRTMVNIADCIKRGELNAEIVTVISSRQTVAGVQRANELGLIPQIIRKKDIPDIDAFSQHIVEVLDNANVDLVCQCGWLCLWKIPEQYKNKVMNIHPGLLPDFGGQGMYGHHVHEAVLKEKRLISGCTVHFVNDNYDAGPVILQRACPVVEDDTPESLAARVFEQECKAYPEAIRLFAEDRLGMVEGKVVIKPSAS